MDRIKKKLNFVFAAIKGRRSHDPDEAKRVLQKNLDFVFAALKGRRQDDLKEVKSILLVHPELSKMRRIDDIEHEDSTLLIEACRQANHKIVQFLLDHGADVSATGRIHFFDKRAHCMIHHGCGFGALEDIFPLFVAAAFNAWPETLMTILSAGADVNQRTAIGQTALHAITCTSSDPKRNDITKFEIDDDERVPFFGIRKIKSLIFHGADVNICDDHGRTALHYAAKCGNRYSAKILLRNGANVYAKDKDGLDTLDYAASKDYFLTMALIDKYNFPMKQIIQAYECVALKSPNPLEVLRKATLLREQHGIPKRVLPPLECYGFEREWEKIEKLEKCDDSELLLQCVLARERISVENHFSVAMDDIFKLYWKDRKFQRKLTKHHFNSLLRHQLDRFSSFGNYFQFADVMIFGGMSLKREEQFEQLLSNDVLVKFVLVAIDSCCIIQDQLNVESKPGCAGELISAMTQTLVMVRALIMHLIRREGRLKPQSKYEVYPRIAKILLDEILHRCPLISAPVCGFASPVTNILYNTEHKPSLFTDYLPLQCLRYNYHFMKMIVESGCDLNATDCEGNTLLHSVIDDIRQEMDFFSDNYRYKWSILTDTAVEIVKLMLDNGSYTLAKNKQGQCPGDGFQNVMSHPKDVSTAGLNVEDVTALFTDLLNEYNCELTLKYLTARKIIDSKIPYRNQLPKAMMKFVELH